VKFNVNRVDNMVIQAIFMLDTLDKDINSFAMRVRFVLCFSLSDCVFSSRKLVAELFIMLLQGMVFVALPRTSEDSQ